MSGRETGHRQVVGPPKFCSRHDRRQSARFTANSRFQVTEPGEHMTTVRLPKIGDVAFIASRKLSSEPSSMTVIREPDRRTRSWVA